MKIFKNTSEKVKSNSIISVLLIDLFIILFILFTLVPSSIHAEITSYDISITIILTLIFLTIFNLGFLTVFKELYISIEKTALSSKYVENMLNAHSLTEVEQISTRDYKTFFNNLKNICTYYAIRKPNSNLVTIYLKFENEHDSRFFEEIEKFYFTNRYKVKESNKM